MLYPRTCPDCKVVYKTKQSYSAHILKGTCSRKCDETKNNIERKEEAVTDLEARMGIMKLENERTARALERTVRELERLRAENLIGPLEMFDGGLYIVHSARFVVAKQNVFKVGRCELFGKRIPAYETGFKVLYFCICKNHVEAERRMLSTFRNLFIPRTDIGYEYFEGDIVKMILEIQKLGIMV